jgi:hypothetical protein
LAKDAARWMCAHIDEDFRPATTRLQYFVHKFSAHNVSPLRIIDALNNISSQPHTQKEECAKKSDWLKMIEHS